jgi:outer membrane protein assembly factor BamB
VNSARTLLSRLRIASHIPAKLALAACLVASTLESGASAQSNFVVQATRDVRDAANASLEHLAAGRTFEGLDSLQFLLEDGREGLLIGSDFAGTLASSSGPVPEWIGAARWARKKIESLSDEERKIYGERTGRNAQRAFIRALYLRSSNELLTIARRFPATQVAARAFIARGDLAFEAGNNALATRSWQDAKRTLDLAVPHDIDMGLALTVRLAATPQSSPNVGNSSTSATAAFPPSLDSAWTIDLPSAPREGFSDFANLRPVIANGVAWLNTGLRVLAIDIFKGTTLWDSGEVTGWGDLSAWARKELVKGIARDTLISKVAVDQASGILVAPLQLPRSDADNDNFGNIQITVSLPERRLFAFDSITGTPLWDHAPRMGDEISLLGASTFPERMRIAAPPLIRNDLVLVPCYELAGRITLFVAAYDLSTGELVWRTRVVGGQQRVNLFGEHESEYNAAPLAASDGKLLILSQLGIVAALDVETGEPIWESSYEQFDLPRANGFYAPRRARVWQAAAPKISDGIVFTTPIDCPDLLALDLASGAPLWSVPAYELRASSFGTVQGETNGRWGLAAPNNRVSNNSRGEIDHLITADRESVWLGGDHLVAWTNDRGDLFEKGPTKTRFPAIKTPSGLLTNNPVSPRPLGESTDLAILVPTDWGILSVDRATGQATPLGPFGDEGNRYYSPGSLGITPGVLLHTDEWRLTGWMHWGTLVTNAEARLAQANLSGSREVDLIRLELAQLRLALATSPRIATAQGLAAEDAWIELQKARELILEASGEIRPFDFSSLRLSESSVAGLNSLVADSHFRLLESEAAWQGTFGEIDRAIALVSQAIAQAPDDAAVCKLLHAQVMYLGNPTLESESSHKARVSTLDMLIALCPREVTPTAHLNGLLDPDIDEFVATVRNLGGVYAYGELPVGLMALLARSAAFARAGEPIRELNDLHGALWEYGLLPLAPGTTVGDLLTKQIHRAIELAPIGTYASFEIAAKAQLDAAISVEAPDRSSSALAGVARRWPHSKAAREARTHLLDIEIGQFSNKLSTFGRLAERVSAVLVDQPSEALTWRSLLALGWAADRSGNPYLARTILTRVASSAPTASADFTKGATAIDLLAELRAPHQAESSDKLTNLDPPLSGSASIGGVRIGPFDPVLTINALLPGERSSSDGGATKRILLSAAGDELYAFEAARDVAPNQAAANSILWVFPVGTRAGTPWSRLLCSLPQEAPEVISVVTNGGIIGISPLSGSLLWSLSRAGSRAVEISGDGGMLVVQWLGSNGELVVEGVDAIGGASLWQTELPADTIGELAGAKLLVSGSAIALLSRENDSSGVLLDGVRGELIDTLKLVGQAAQRDRAAAWARNGTLFLPHFLAGTDQRPNTVDAIDMSTGGLNYSIDFGTKTELVGIAHFEERSCLWLFPTGEEGVLGAKAKLVEFDTKLGATRDLADLSSGDRVIGLPIGETLTLDGPLLLVASKPSLMLGFGMQGPMTLRAFGLPRGLLWTRNISPPDVLGQGLYDGDLPPVVLARDTIAMTYAITKSGQALGRSTRLLLLDRSDGRILDDRPLTTRLGRLEGLSLRGLGSDLYLFGRGIGSGRGRLEVLGGKR